MAGDDLSFATAQRLLYRDDDPHRPSLENRVAYQWEAGTDTLGYRNARLRDDTILRWSASVLGRSVRPAEVLDIGCAYGNLLLMLNAYMGLDQQIHYAGIDIDDRGLAYGQVFAESLEGFANCNFLTQDITAPLPIESGTLDLVIAADVLEHLPDMASTVGEINRVLKSTGRLIISTPLADSAFKRLARRANVLTKGSINKAYYRGKDAELDADGQPVMDVHAGLDHVSEMPYDELVAMLRETGFALEQQQLTPVMSGSKWFDAHPFLLAGLIGLEAIHSRLQRPSWAHGICLQLRKIP